MSKPETEEQLSQFKSATRSLRKSSSLEFNICRDAYFARDDLVCFSYETARFRAQDIDLGNALNLVQTACVDAYVQLHAHQKVTEVLDLIESRILNPNPNDLPILLNQPPSNTSTDSLDKRPKLHIRFSDTSGLIARGTSKGISRIINTLIPKPENEEVTPIASHGIPIFRTSTIVKGIYLMEFKLASQKMVNVLVNP